MTVVNVFGGLVILAIGSNISPNGSGISNSDVSFLQQCCNDGHNAVNCVTQYVRKPDYVNDQLCYTTFYGCCSTKKSNDYCESGKVLALSRKECNSTHISFRNDPSSHFVEDCCQYCRLGIALGSIGTKSDSTCFPGARTLTENAIDHCCQETKKSPRNLLYSQLDVPKTGQNVEASASGGIFKLLVPIAPKREDICSKCQFDCETNWNRQKQCFCQFGYELEENGHGCRAIDECNKSPSPCDLAKYECKSYAGRHNCVVKSPFDTICSDGFFFNATSMLCQENDSCK